MYWNYDENGDLLKTEIRYPNGLKVTNTDEGDIQELGKTEAISFPGAGYLIKTVSVNKGLPNQTNFEISYNEDFEAVDIKLNSDTLIGIDDKNKKVLLDLINSRDEKLFGKDYDIQVDGYSIVVSELKNE